MPRTHAQAVTDAAFDYLDHDLSVLPLRVNAKQPTGPWRDLQHRRLTTGDVDDRFDSSTNIGIVTGRISGLVVIDIDGDLGEASLAALEVPEPSVQVQTPRGRHLYYAHPGGTVQTRGALLPGTDVRADGGYVVAPPSRIGEAAYAWVADRAITEHAPDELPAVWRALLEQPPAQPPTNPPLVFPPQRGHADWPATIAATTPEGQRNDTLCRLAGYLLGARRLRVNVDTITALLTAWNDARCMPPLLHSDIARTVHALDTKERSKRPHAPRPRRARKGTR